MNPRGKLAYQTSRILTPTSFLDQKIGIALL